MTILMPRCTGHVSTRCQSSATFPHRMRRFASLVLASATITACDRPAAPIPGITSTAQSVGRFSPGTGAAIPTPLGRALLKQCTRSTPWGVVRFWAPTQPMLNQVEGRLPTLIDSVLKQVSGSETARLSAQGYYRQYIGIQRWTGKRTIYINGFHRTNLEAINRAMAPRPRNANGHTDSLEWRTTPVNVCDGGTLFFGVEYDPEKGTFSRVEFNDRITGSVTY